MDEAHEAIEDIQKIKANLSKLRQKTQLDSTLLFAINEIDSINTEIEKALYQTKNRSRQDPLNYPIKLTNKLAHLNSLTQMNSSDFPPTDQAIAVKEELITKINAQLEKFEQVNAELIPELNKQINLKGIPFIDN